MQAKRIMETKDLWILPRRELRLRRIGSRYLIADICEGAVNLTDVFTLNASAARLWEHLQETEACTVAEAAAWLASAYGISGEVALRDVSAQVDEWCAYGLVSLSDKVLR